MHIVHSGVIIMLQTTEYKKSRRNEARKSWMSYTMPFLQLKSARVIKFQPNSIQRNWAEIKQKETTSIQKFPRDVFYRVIFVKKEIKQ